MRRRFRGASPLRRNKFCYAVTSQWRDHGLGEIMNPKAMAGHHAFRCHRFDDRTRKRCQRMILPPTSGRLPDYGRRLLGSGYEISFRVVDEGAKMDAFRMRVGVASPPRDRQVIKPVAAAAPNIAATRYRIGNSSSDGDHALAELSSSNIGLLFPRALLSAIASRASAASSASFTISEKSPVRRAR